MITLLSTIISFLAGGLPKLLDFFQDSKDKSHELRMMQMQKEREMELAERGFAAQAKIEEIKNEAVFVQTAASQQSALLNHDIEIGKGASTWVINLRALVRPLITYGMFLLLCAVDGFGFYYAIKTDVAFADAMALLWDSETQIIWASVVSFHFGSQAFKK
jgi:hypothetical protein